MTAIQLQESLNSNIVIHSSVDTITQYVIQQVTLMIQLAYTNSMMQNMNLESSIEHHPLVQGWVHDQTKQDYYKYTILGAYVLAGLSGMIGAWMTIIYLKWLAGPEMFNW